MYYRTESGKDPILFRVPGVLGGRVWHSLVILTREILSRDGPLQGRQRDFYSLVSHYAQGKEGDSSMLIEKYSSLLLQRMEGKCTLLSLWWQIISLAETIELIN